MISINFNSRAQKSSFQKQMHNNKMLTKIQRKQKIKKKKDWTDTRQTAYEGAFFIESIGPLADDSLHYCK